MFGTNIVIEVRCIGNIGSTGNKVAGAETVDVTTMSCHSCQEYKGGEADVS
jgi:hypothetical protein